MTKSSKLKKCFYTSLTSVLLLSGVAVSGLVIDTPQLAFSQKPPEPRCVCAECGRPCGSGHAKGCSSRPK